jgi:hypothetical protein
MADDIEIYQRGNWPEVPPTIQVGHGTRAGDSIKIWDLENIIYFKDATVLADTVAALGGSRLLMSPAKARQLLGISTSAPFISATGAFDPAVTIWIDYPMNRTHFYDPPIGGQWQVQRLPISTTGLPFGFNPADIPFHDETVDWFIVNGWTSVAAPSFPWPPYRFQWSFQLLQFGGVARNPPTEPPAPAPISQRRWIEGFEVFADGAGGSGGVQVARAASRHVDGMGCPVRNTNNQQWLKSISDFAGGTTKSEWQKGYVRLRRPPGTDGMGNSIWRIAGASSPGNTNALRVNTLGQLELTTTAAVLATSAVLITDVWMRLDILFNYSSGAGGTFQLYLDHQLTIDLSGILSNGLGQNQNYLNCGLGCPDANPALGLEIDLDDWMAAPIPPALTGMDWQMGSRIMLINITGFDSNVNWTGDFRGPIGNPVLSTNAIVSTNVQQSLLRFTTDWHDQQLAEVPAAVTPSGAAPLFQNGCAAAVLGWFCQGSGAGHNFRMRDGAGNIVASQVNTVGVQAFYNAMYRPSGMITPNILGAVTMEWETPAVAGTNQVYGAFIQAEDLGIFGVEDLDPTLSPPPAIPAPIHTGIHNAPYPRSPWALVGGAPQSNVMVAYGVYVGNGTGADLNLPYPPCWLYIRPVTPAGANGVRWWSSQFTGHEGVQPGIHSPDMPQALQDPAFNDAIGNSLLRRAGAGVSVNANGNTFQYVAFCDPGQRFVTNGAFATPAAVASAIQALRLAGFTPDAGFFNVEQVGTLTTTDWWYKGIGHTGANAQRMNAAETTNVVTMAMGQLTTQTPLHQSGTLSRPQTSYSLWRMQDGVSSGASQGVVVAIMSYVGDGNASRVISVPLGGRFPCYAQVTPHNALSWVRDPSHTGANSSQLSTLNSTSTTAITAGGINSITVGITLNANGIVYDVFVIPSCSQTGWDNNGGDYCPLNFGGYENDPPEPYVPSTPVEGTPDLCVNDWDTPRADGLPYVPLMPGSQQDENQ